VDSSGNAYVTGWTGSSDFPAVVGPDTSYNGGQDAFVAKVGAGGGPEPFTGTISPVYPSAHTASSTVMQGGTAYRHFRLLDCRRQPHPQCHRRLLRRRSGHHGRPGLFHLHRPGSALGNPGSYP
jgi:hypothetical protein